MMTNDELNRLQDAMSHADRVNELARHLIAQPSLVTAGFGITMSGANGRVVDLTKLMGECKAALESIVAPAVPEPVELTPAVPIRKSVTDDFIICLEDGKKFKSLKRHLRTHYDLSPEEYREKWGLPADYPMVAPSYSATRSKLAKDTGLGTKK